MRAENNIHMHPIDSGTFMTILTMGLYVSTVIIGAVTLQALAAVAAILAGVSTFVFNIYRFYKEYKEKQDKKT